MAAPDWPVCCQFDEPSCLRPLGEMNEASAESRRTLEAAQSALAQGTAERETVETELQRSKAAFAAQLAEAGNEVKNKPFRVLEGLKEKKKEKT